MVQRRKNFICKDYISNFKLKIDFKKVIYYVVFVFKRFILLFCNYISWLINFHIFKNIFTGISKTFSFYTDHTTFRLSDHGPKNSEKNSNNFWEKMFEIGSKYVSPTVTYLNT